MTTKVPLSTRVEPKLAELIQAQAREGERSVAAQVRLLLKVATEQEKAA